MDIFEKYIMYAEMYLAEFGETFPTYAVGDLSIEKQIDLMIDCMNNDTPYTPNYKDGAKY